MDRQWKIGDVAECVPVAKAPPAAGGQAAWYAVQTNPQQEATAADRLRQDGIELFYPRYWLKVRYVRVGPVRRAGEVLRPFLPGYLFARTDGRFSTISSTVGVRDLVRVGGLPVPITDAVIVAFRAGFDEAGIRFPEAPLPPRFYVGDHVRVIEGPFEGWYGQINRIDTFGHLRILLTIFGRLVPVQVLADWVESIAPTSRAERAPSALEGR